MYTWTCIHVHFLIAEGLSHLHDAVSALLQRYISLSAEVRYMYIQYTCIYRHTQAYTCRIYDVQYIHVHMYNHVDCRLSEEVGQLHNTAERKGLLRGVCLYSHTHDGVRGRCSTFSCPYTLINTLGDWGKGAIFPPPMYILISPTLYFHGY